MSEQAQKLMLVDETAFAFLPSGEDDKTRNALLLTFLRDAQGIFQTVVVTDRDIPSVQADLQKTDFSEAINPRYKIAQDFLSKDIQPWENFEGKRADVIISPDEFASTRTDDYDFIKHPSDIYAPDYFDHFWECYEDNLMMSFRGMKALVAQIELTRIEIQHAMDKTYPNIGAVWRKVLAEPDVEKLAQTFAAAEQRSWHKRHPQDDIVDHLKHYFEYVSLGPRIPCQAGLKANLDSCRHWLMREFKSHHIDGKYERTNRDILDEVPEAPLEAAHRSLTNRALLAVHRVVKNEPTKRL